MMKVDIRIKADVSEHRSWTRLGESEVELQIAIDIARKLDFTTMLQSLIVDAIADFEKNLASRSEDDD